jgi:phosphoribosylformylglycinamidine cyclo-ligase
MVLVAAPGEAASLITELTATGETAFPIGIVVTGEKGCTVFGSAEAWSAREAWEAVHIG